MAGPRRVTRALRTYMRGFLGRYLFWPWFSGMGKLCQFHHLLEMRVDDIGEWGVGKKVGCEIFEPGDIVGRTMRIAFNEQQPILVDYRLKQDAGEWKVYDVAVDSISITANYRNQFNRVINNQGFDTLMTEMQNKQQELIASLGR